MKPKILFSGRVHLLPEISTELKLSDIDGLNSITLDVGYLPIFNNSIVFAELSDSFDSFKVVAIRLTSFPKPSQRSISFDSSLVNDLVNPVKVYLISEFEVFFNLKILGI